MWLTDPVQFQDFRESAASIIFLIILRHNLPFAFYWCLCQWCSVNVGSKTAGVIARRGFTCSRALHCHAVSFRSFLMEQDKLISVSLDPSTFYYSVWQYGKCTQHFCCALKCRVILRKCTGVILWDAGWTSCLFMEPIFAWKDDWQAHCGYSELCIWQILFWQMNQVRLSLTEELM